jgi:hypothetical protein
MQSCSDWIAEQPFVLRRKMQGFEQLVRRISCHLPTYLVGLQWLGSTTAAASRKLLLRIAKLGAAAGRVR